MIETIKKEGITFRLIRADVGIKVYYLVFIKREKVWLDNEFAFSQSFDNREEAIKYIDRYYEILKNSETLNTNFKKERKERMLKKNIERNFKDSICAIEISNQNELEEFKIFLGMNNIFTKDGGIASQINCSSYPVIFYMNSTSVPRYVDTASREYLLGYMYNIFKYSEACEIQEQQMNFFGGEDAHNVRQPDKELIADPMEDTTIEADAKIVKNELSLNEAFNSIVVGEVVPAEIKGYSIEAKDTIIKEVSKYKNTVVTADNYNDLEKETLKGLRAKQKDIESARAKFKKKALEKVDVYVADMTEIANTLKDVISSLKTNIDVFVTEENKRVKEALYNEIINPILDISIEKGIIDEQTRTMFEFNDRWLNKSARTSTGNLTKKTSDEINAELNRLAEMYSQKQKDIATIKSTVENLAIAHGVDKETLKADTYLDLYKNGYSMPQVQQRINDDLANIKKAFEREKEKARIEAENKQREAVQGVNAQQAQNNVAEEKIAESDFQEEMFNLVDEKIDAQTGEKISEVVAVGNSKQIKVKIDENKVSTNTYEYVYCFSGNLQSMVTFNRVIKLLTKMFGFKAERILQVKSSEHRKLIDEFKEKVGK